jgi:hypothetical protein
MSAPHLRLVAGRDSRSPAVAAPSCNELGECLEFPGAMGPNLTTFRYTLMSGESVVVTVPTALCGPHMRAMIWDLFEAADSL